MGSSQSNHAIARHCRRLVLPPSPRDDVKSRFHKPSLLPPTPLLPLPVILAEPNGEAGVEIRYALEVNLSGYPVLLPEQ